MFVAAGRLHDWVREYHWRIRGREELTLGGGTSARRVEYCVFVGCAGVADAERLGHFVSEAELREQSMWLTWYLVLLFGAVHRPEPQAPLRTAHTKSKRGQIRR